MDDSDGLVDDDFLSCPICAEEYTDPRALPCLHTFCLACISDHIDNNTRGIHTPKGFNCPKCHQLVEAPNPLQGPATWAEALPQNQLINGLIQAVKLRTDDRKCDPCDSRGQRSLASVWCENCGEAMCQNCKAQHDGLKISRTHIIVDIATIKSQPMKSTMLRTPCQEHAGKFLEFYCDDHAQVICSTCATGFHRGCTTILSSADTAVVYRDEAKSALEKLKYQSNWGLRILDNRRHAIDTLEEASTKVKKQISGIREQINEMLSAQEERALVQLGELKNAEMQQLKREEGRSQDLLNTTKNATTVLANSLNHGTDADVITTFIKAKRESRLCEKSLKEVAENLKELSLVFTPDNGLQADKGLQAYLGTLNEMGKFSLTHTTVNIPPPYKIRADTILDETLMDTHMSESLEKHDDDFPPSPAITPLPRIGSRVDIPKGRLDTFFKVRTSQDRDNCCITGADFVSGDRIVVADQVHRKIKLFDREYRWIGERVLSARPYDIAALSGSEIAVTLPREKRFLLMQIRNTDFHILAAIQTGAKCWGIAYSNYMLAVCCYESPPCIKIMSRDGRELKVISQDSVGHNMFFFPDYVVLDRTATCLYVTDRYKRTVVAVTTQGDKLWEIRYEGLKVPKGIALHGNSLLVAGCKSHNIMMINTDGTILGDVIVEGVSNPHKLVLAPGSDRLLVTQYAMTLIDIERNTVKLFSMPWA